MSTHPSDASMAHPILDARQKALQINLDSKRYGTFAEIGAGQEVARWFFRVGATSGTVAKTMSAYDMLVSDAVYGKTGRYVSRQRLLAMLDHEYPLLINRLAATRGENTGFFAFADTVATRNFAGTNEAHGWIGLRFQHQPQAEPSQIILHVNMSDTDAPRQQEALGILGVNLLHGAFYAADSVELLLERLKDGLSPSRIEIDFVDLRGPAFPDVDPRLITVALVRHGLAHAVLFDDQQQPVPPTEFFHKRPILLERGSFRVLHHLFPNLVPACAERLRTRTSTHARNAVYVLEMSLNNVLKSRQTNDTELLTVLNQLKEQGSHILISDYSEFFHLTQYLRRFSSEPIGFIVSVAMLPLLFQDQRYGLLKGGVLEASARLFQQQVHLLVYPVESSLISSYLTLINFDASTVEFPASGLVSAESVRLKSVNDYLLRYLVESGIIIEP